MDSGETDRKPVRVTIFGQSYALRASADAREIQELAQQVDDLMAGIASRSGDTEAARVAVLTCLHLADRLRDVERELTGLRQRVESKSKEFSLLLDQALAPDRHAQEHSTTESKPGETAP
jgi:cell division protein ZapA